MNDHTYSKNSLFYMNIPIAFEADPQNLAENKHMSNTKDYLNIQTKYYNDTQHGTGIQAKENVVCVTEHFNYFTIHSKVRRYFSKFKIDGQEIRIKFKNPHEEQSLIDWLELSLNELLEYSKLGTSANGRLALIFKNIEKNFEPIHISFRRPDQLNINVVLDRLSSILQSNADFFFNDHLDIEIHYVDMPLGCGRTRFFGNSSTDFLSKKRSIIEVKNKDNNCLSYALCVAIAYVEKDSDLKNLIRYSRPSNKLSERAIKLCRDSNIDLSNGGGLEETIKFQNFFKNQYKITVYNSRKGDSVIFSGIIREGLKSINLLLENGHYGVIKSLTAAFAYSYYCEDCHKGYGSKHAHKKCIYSCPLCFLKPVCSKNNDLIKCHECLRNFRGVVCFENHQKLICKKLKTCGNCNIGYEVRNNVGHVCGKSYCSICCKLRPIRHDCYMPCYRSKYNEKTASSFLHIYYDFESTQNKILPGTSEKFEHSPNLCVVNQICNTCVNDTEISLPCSYCGQREYIFEGEKSLELFMTYLTHIPTKFKNVIIIAHNSSGYDAHFILRYMYQSGSYDSPKIIMNGSKILLIQTERYKFIDSLNYFSVALSKLPKMFALPEQKGYYPHFFNTTDNYNYVGVIPDTKYFDPDSMDPKNRNIFFEWYKKQKEICPVYNNRCELIKYCSLDVEILRKACIKFWATFLSENNIDPFLDAITIAGACNKVFRSKYLKEDTIGIIPKNGYRFSDNQSKIALEWLLWIEHINKIKIIHAGHGKEFRLKENILVDGFHVESNTVYEFLGCYYHGCIKCYPIQTVSTNGKGDLLTIRRENTDMKCSKIRMSGYKLISIYECEFKNLKMKCLELSDFLINNMYFKIDPLNPRDAFYGGRTNAIKLYYKATSEEKIYYYDVCSLYPFINKYFKYPIGHPKIYVGEECLNKSIDCFEGILKCTILPPKTLYHPVLPTKMHGKLLFVLCNTCALNKSNISCSHTDEERFLIGTWVVDEVREAVKKGYEIIKIHEIWEYQTVVYDKINKSNGLFTGYVNQFLKSKTESSGWPTWCSDSVDKNKYINNYYEKEGIHLNNENITYNSGLRSLSKIMLNSFWGKFGQRENMSQNVIVKCYEEFVSKLIDPSIEVESYVVLSETALLVSYKTKEEANYPLNHVNIAIAAYTTAGARLELYKYLDQLGNRILYFDTDSIIFTQKCNENNPLIGDYLGDLTDELNGYGKNSYISEFVSGGPKNYALRIWSTIQHDYINLVKVKGITLNYLNSKLINFNIIKDIVLNDCNNTEIMLENKQILRTRDHHVYTDLKRQKKYRFCYTKRRRVNLDEYDTLPFGYCENGI